MTLQSSQPDNKNFLSPLGFTFRIKKIPHVNYFCTKANLPELNLAVTNSQPTPFVNIPRPGDKLDYGNLTLTFKVDQDMKNYREINDWLVVIAYPDSFNQRDNDNVYSDGTLIITTEQYIPNIEIKYLDLFPSNLSPLDFSITESDVDYLESQVTFIYRKYEIEGVT